MKHLTLLLLGLAGTFLSAQPQNVLLLDRFDNYPTNALQEDVQGFFVNDGSILLQTVEGAAALGGGGASLQASFNVQPDTSFCGITFFLPPTDLSGHHYFSFWIKGEIGREYLSVELTGPDSTTAKVALWDYLACGPTTTWQKAVIPMDAFWNLSARDTIVKLSIVFENYQSATNGSPLQSTVWLDELLFGSHDPGYVKIDGFSDALKSNATSANTGEFSETGSEDNYTSTLIMQDAGTCDHALRIDYDNDDGDLFGGLFTILGGGTDGWTPAWADLSCYSHLQVRCYAQLSQTNPGNVKVELKAADGTTHAHRITGITTTPQTFSIPLDAFSPPVAAIPIGEFVVVFEANRQLKPQGTLLLDEVLLSSDAYAGPDETAPDPLTGLTLNGQPATTPLAAQVTDLLTFATANEYADSRTESAYVEMYDGCAWQQIWQVYAPLSQPLQIAVPADRLIPNTAVSLRLVVQNYNGQTVVSEPVSVTVTDPNALSAAELFRNAYILFELLRTETGVYTDALRFSGEQFHPVSVATTGSGLIALCIADAMGWIGNAEALVVETLEAVNGLRPGFDPARNAKGWFRHFIDAETGARAWESEFSSIDSGILVAGALFCKKYFGDNPAIADLADLLCESIRWESMIKDPATGAIYLTADEAGNGGEHAALPFNEYMIVAWLAKNDPRDSGRAAQLWDNFFATTDNLPKKSLQGIETLTDHPGHFLSGFIPQFCYFMCHHFTSDPDYLQFFANQLRADSTWWRNNTDEACYVWGFGAGASTVASGYHADAIDNHPGTICSPHIVAGAIPVQPEALGDLLLLARDGRAAYQLPGSDESILWRFSTEQPTWRAEDVQGIDFSSLLFGMAAHPDFLSTEFFLTHTDFDFPIKTETHNNPPILSSESFQIRPNVISDSATFWFRLDSGGEVAIQIFSALGDPVYTRPLGRLPAGEHTYHWTGKNDRGRALTSGNYFCRLTVSGQQLTLPMIYVKE